MPATGQTGDVADGVAAPALGGHPEAQGERREHLPGKSRMRSQCNWMVWAGGQLGVVPPNFVERWPMTRSWSGVSRPAGTLIRSIIRPIFGLSW